MNDFKITVAGIVAATLSFALLYFFVYVQPLTGCENKKQFKIDTTEVLNLLEKGWNSPRYLAPSVFAEAKGKYEIMKLKYPHILSYRLPAYSSDYINCGDELFSCIFWSKEGKYTDYLECKQHIESLLKTL